MVNYKKYLLIVFGAMAVLLLVILVWQSWQTGTPATPSATSTVTLFPTGAERPGGVSTGFNWATSTPNTGASTTPETTPRDKSGNFFRVSSRPVGGITFTGTGTSTVLLYVERATGHLYRLPSAAATPERISNTTIPKITSLDALTNGTSTTIIFQHPVSGNGNPETLAAPISLDNANLGGAFLDSATAAPVALVTRVLGNQITSIAPSPDHKQVFWLEETGNSTQGYLVDLKNGDKKTAVFSSPIADWQAAWVATSTIALQTRASANYPGALYWLDLKTKKLTNIINNVPGLTTLPSPKLDKIFYSGLFNHKLVAGFYDVSRHFFSRLNLQTWAEKCAWAKDAKLVYCAAPSVLPASADYPDSWYRGELSLNDNIWKIDPATGQNEIIYNSTTSDLAQKYRLDASNLLISPDNSTLYLINRADDQLWALNLKSGF